MKIQSIKIGESEHYSITLPKKIVEFIGWKKGIELEAVLGKNKEIILREKTQ